MANSSNPLRNEAEEFIRAEIARVGPDAIDKAAIVRRFVERGASKSRLHEWIRDLVHDAKNPPLDTREADLAVAEAAVDAAERAKVLDSLPGPEDLAQVERAAQAAIKAPALGASFTLLPEGAAAALDRLQTMIETTNRVLDYSLHADGRIKNPRMVLASVEATRKALETTLKLYEAVDPIKVLQQFLAEVMAELRTMEPELAMRVVDRLRDLQGRWSA